MKRFSLPLVCIALLATFAGTALTDSFMIGPKPEKKWMMELYPNGHAAGTGKRPGSLVVSSTGVATAVGLAFTSGPDTTAFTTVHPAYGDTLLGNLLGRTVQVEYVVTAPQPFDYYRPGNPCDDQGARVRLFFQTSDVDGPSRMWWSNPEDNLLEGGPGTLTALMDPSQWSDLDGHKGDDDPAHIAAFNLAAAGVQEIGLSFGGGCFFMNGVGSPGAFLGVTAFRLY